MHSMQGWDGGVAGAENDITEIHTSSRAKCKFKPLMLLWADSQLLHAGISIVYSSSMLG